MKIRKASYHDYDDIWEIFSEVISSGDTYVFSEHTPKEDLKKHWFGENMQTYVIEDQGLILGTYILKPNHVGRGKHIANASYMIKGSVRGKGLGGLLCAHSVEEAKKAGFKAMQFNLVVATNEGAIKMWKKYGFEIVGTIPNAFDHAKKGLIDAFVMHRSLE
ncbi:MAG: N-acetyltransferase [Bacteroidota bacterium]